LRLFIGSSARSKKPVIEPVIELVIALVIAPVIFDEYFS